MQKCRSWGTHEQKEGSSAGVCLVAEEVEQGKTVRDALTVFLPKRLAIPAGPHPWAITLLVIDPHVMSAHHTTTSHGLLAHYSRAHPAKES